MRCLSVKLIPVCCIPPIENVKYQYSERTDKFTTIVFWGDGTKTMVTTADDEEFSQEHGIEQCIIKKVVGNRSRLKKIFKRWCNDVREEDEFQRCSEAHD